MSDPHQPQIAAVPLQNWHAMGVRRGTFGFTAAGWPPSRSPSEYIVCATEAGRVSVGGARLQQFWGVPGQSSCRALVSRWDVGVCE